MTYLLSDDGRERDVIGAFRRYRQYILSKQTAFPQSAYALAASDWYFDFTDHRCPHDAWLKSCELTEIGQGERRQDRTLSLKLRLLGSYHDGHIEIFYPRVLAYSLNAEPRCGGHCDWRYDEILVSDRGNALHVIEWGGPQPTGRWQIEASDIEYRWIPTT